MKWSNKRMKHLLILLISILLLSSPVIGQSERPETVIVPVSGIGDVSNTRKLILKNTCKMYKIVAIYISIILPIRIQL